MGRLKRICVFMLALSLAAGMCSCAKKGVSSGDNKPESGILTSDGVVVDENGSVIPDELLESGAVAGDSTAASGATASRGGTGGSANPGTSGASVQGGRSNGQPVTTSSKSQPVASQPAVKESTGTVENNAISSTGDFAKYVRMAMPGKSGIAFAGESESITLRIGNSGRSKAKKASVLFTFTSIDGDKQTVTKEFDETSGGSSNDVVVSVQSVPGYWQLDVSISLDGKSMGTGKGIYAVVNKPLNFGKTDSGSFFGVMFAPDAEAAQRIGVKHERVCAYWRFIQQTKSGAYYWTELDNAVNECIKNNISVNLLIQPEVSLFGAKLKGFEINSCMDVLKPEILEAYRKFVRATVERYKNKVNLIEICNEPDMNLVKAEMGWGDLTAAQAGQVTATLMYEGYKIIKELAPSMPVSGLSVSQRDYYSAKPSGGKKPSYTESILSFNTSWKLCDIFSIHPYASPSWKISGKGADAYKTPEEYGLYNHLKNGISYIKGKNRGINNVHVTEIGYTVDHVVSELDAQRRTQAALLARSMVMCKSFPEITRGLYFDMRYYNPDDGTDDFSIYNYVKSTGVAYPYAAAAAYAQCSYQLHNASPAKTISSTGKIGAYQFNSGSQSVAVVWIDRTTRDINLSGVSSLAAYDMFGRQIAKGNMSIRLSEEPVYLTANLSDAAKLTSAVQSAIG